MENKNKLAALAERVTKQLSDFYNGNLWVTENLEKKIFSLSADVTMKKVQGNTHSIAELVCHIIAWRNFGLQKLIANSAYDIEDNSAADWPLPVDWDSVRKEFDLCHHDLLNAIKSFPAEKLNATVPGRSYSFLYLINGIVEHDYYHYGQIGSVLSAIKKME
ncbi:MAG: DinB family protein [Bacteroidota bacterium]|nr:DinB family protein [Bacteroidota bacterium]